MAGDFDVDPLQPDVLVGVTASNPMCLEAMLLPAIE
jgi:hypothetical protein